jgi:adenine-specific DNA methylase
MTSDRRLIEVAFPLKQTSLDSVHEKNVRHGHISTLHIWPARRPLAACRAALIATLLPDPGDDAERDEILKRLAGTVKTITKTRTLPDGQVEEIVKEVTEGGILHWKRESGPDLDWFRQKIRAAYGGRAPKVLDPFAGGGAIPLEAMRLGCEATAVDINPVAWFILKCTLEYPQRLAGQTRPLPDFVLQDRDFMADFFKKARGLKGANLKAQLDKLGLGESEAATIRLPGMAPDVDVEADLAWHVRAWGWWVLQRARADLAPYYPTVDGKPTVAYLWARTVTCKNCRATIPLLKTRWLAKKAKKRVALTMEPNADRTGVVFGIDDNPPTGKDVGKGTMSRAGATCPCCSAIMTSGDIRTEAQAGRLGSVMTAVVVVGDRGKEYRLPAREEHQMATEAEKTLEHIFAEIPFGLPEEPVPQGASRTGGGSPFTIYLYGLTQWCDLFTPRQLLALGTFAKYTRATYKVMRTEGYSTEWVEAIGAYLACMFDRLNVYSSSLCRWINNLEAVAPTFARFALPILWDFCEARTTSSRTGGYGGAVNWIFKTIEHLLYAADHKPTPKIVAVSATRDLDQRADLILTDPPYYDAIPYSDLMDFFYIWLRRVLHNLSPEIDLVFSESLGPKWDHEASDGELIDDASRFSGDKQKSKLAYEEGMARAFQTCHRALGPEGRLVVVFAHKQPDAWETLVSAIIRAGFVVNGSWPIQTEREARSRAYASAALASSVWLVCKKRKPTARPGWDNRVLAEMRDLIAERLRTFWDAGIRGPDFVWAATGPAMEAYSKYPIVKKANAPGQVMTVTEFLGHVRRIVVDFVVGRVLSGDGAKAVTGLDDVTTYYLLHRHDFGMAEAPAGAAILYALSCNVSDRDLVDRHHLLTKRGSTLQLLPWSRRKDTGYDPVLDAPASHGAEALPLPGFETSVQEPELRELPLIDQAHRLMHLWRAGDVTKVDAYLDARGLRRSQLFHQLLQALIELAPAGSEERALLESISNHLGLKETTRTTVQRGFASPDVQ